MITPKPNTDADPKRKPRTAKDRGAALVAVLMMSLVLFAFIIAISILVNQRFHSVNLRQAQNKAKYGAQAGMARSLDELSSNPHWTAGFSAVAMAGDSEVTYTVDVHNNYLGALGDPGGYGPDGKTWIPKGTVWVRSVGTMGTTSEGAAGLIGLWVSFVPPSITLYSGIPGLPYRGLASSTP